MTQDIEQYRSGFEANYSAWQKGAGASDEYVFLSLQRNERGEYSMVAVQSRWEGWIAAKREASTEPVAYALLRNGKVEGVERTIQCARMWVNAEIAPLFMDEAPVDALDAARYRTLIAQHPGDMCRMLEVPGTKVCIDEAIDEMRSAIATSTSKGDANDG